MCPARIQFGSFKHTINLKARTDKEFTIVLGQTTGMPEVVRMINKYRDIKTAHAELAATKAI